MSPTSPRCFKLHSLLYCPKYNTSSGTTHLRMFQNCYSLKYLPDIDLSSTTNLQEFAEGCSNHRDSRCSCSIHFRILPDRESDVQACYSLRECPAMNLSGCTNFTSMFASCFNLTKVGQLQTGSGTSSLPCLSLQLLCHRGDSSWTHRLEPSSPKCSADVLHFFASPNSTCRAELPSITCSLPVNLSVASTMRWIHLAARSSRECSIPHMLMRLPAMDLSAVTSNTGIDSNATSGRMTYRTYNLSEGTFVGATRAISIATCKFGQAELVDIFNALGTAAGTQVINITQNPGAILLTAEERAIATGKGWTITG
jgi:hypothetical protein